MENKDLKWIKKHYGEKFSHLCRQLFPTLLETEGLLSDVIRKHFLPSRDLYEDIVTNNLTSDLQNYIYSLTNSDNSFKITNKSPEELMDEAGYILYPECKTEEDVQSFRHYYYRNGKPTPKYKGGVPEHYEGEELCTFNGGRLNTCRVWFAVKKNADEIKRKAFTKPRREDDYGVSVISIQFSKNTPSTLSIKNRYNHTIKNVSPDATFGNNLDNIITGLTQAFVDKYGIDLAKKSNSTLEIPNYVQTADGIFHKYNLEINDIYFCPNNTIIVNGEAKTLNQSQYLLFDQFVLDVQNQQIIDFSTLVPTSRKDSFIDSVGKIDEIKRIQTKDGTTIQLTPPAGEIIEIKLNKLNQIVGYSNSNVTEIGDAFLYSNNSLKEISLPSVTEIRDDFLYDNTSLTKLSLPKVQKIGSGFLSSNDSLKEISLPSVTEIGDFFLYNNISLKEISLPKVQKIEKRFLSSNDSLKEISLPSVTEIGDLFLYSNDSLTKLSLPKVQKIGTSFLSSNDSLKEISLPSVTEIGGAFLHDNTLLTKLSLPKVQKIGSGFLYNNNSLTKLSLPKVQKIGKNFLFLNNSLKELSLPSVTEIEKFFLYSNNSLTELSLPKVQEIGKSFLSSNDSLKELSLPSVTEIGDCFLFLNNSLKEISLPSVTEIGDFFLHDNTSLTKLSLPKVQKIGESFLFRNNSLTELSIPSVQWLGEFFLHNNNSLTNVSVPDQFRSRIKALKQKGTVKSDLQKTSEEDETENV